MSADPPAGYLTRPEASRKYNRSQRALERDLDSALGRQDQDELLHWKLITKDGQVREGTDVSRKSVKQLVTDGMNPAWCVAESFLAETYGLKGAAKPVKAAETALHQTEKTSTQTQSTSALPGVDEQPAPARDDVEFLKERILKLEREKQQEIERHDQVVSRLFEQLAVKDKQISAWDDVTQNITKGLATGQLQPRPVSPEPPPTKSSPRRDERPDTNAAEVIDTIANTKAPKRRKKKTSSQPKPATKPKKSSVRAKPPNKSPRQKSKARWYETPTLNRFLRR